MKSARVSVYCPALVFRFVTMCLFLQMLGIGMAEEASPDAKPGDASAIELVGQLGAGSFDQRQAAESELLALGHASKAVLLEGLQSNDLHVRRTCRRLLDEILEADLRKRLDALVADSDGTGQHDLPGWKRYQETVGSDPEARKLYAEMLKTEGGLLESFAAGGDAASSALHLRVRQVRSLVYARTVQQRRLPDISTLAAITFVASDPTARGLATNELNNIIGLYQRKEFADKVKQSKPNDAVRRVLGRFILSASDTRLSRQSLQMAVTLQIKEPGVRLALRLLEDAPQQQQQSVAGAIGVVALLGGKDLAGAIVPLLDDERQCGIRMVNGKRQATNLQDVAAAWLVKLTDQSLNDYGLGGAAKWFDSVRSNPAACFSVTNIRFEKDEDRKACLDKLRTWLADNPPSTVELEPAPKSGAAPPQPGKGALAKPAQPEKKEPDDPKHTVVLADYSVARQLRSARKLVAEKEYGRVAAILGDILAAEKDSLFQPARFSEAYRSVKAEAASILRSLPREAMDEYEMRFGPVAKHQLNEALDAGNMQALADVERRFLFTQAGRQAAYLLAVYHRSRGKPWLASVYLQRLGHVTFLDQEQRALLPLELAVCWLLAGRPDAVRHELEEWKQQWPRRSVQLGGKEVAVFADSDDPYLWLQKALAVGGQKSRDWFVSRGDITGSKESGGGALWPDPKPLLAMAEHTVLKKILKQIGDERRERRVGAVSTLESLVIGDLLIQRTPTELKAIDRDTGQLRWRFPAENALEHVLHFASTGQRDRFSEAIKSGLERRLWEDMSWGALSSNGRLVFAVEDLSFDLGVDYQRIATRLDGTRQLDAGAYQRENAISAYDIDTGKLVWQIGEVFGESSAEIQGGRFLGPPLPLGDQLYAVVDFTEDTRLLMIDAADGGIVRQWILQIREGTRQKNIGVSSSVVQTPPPVRNSPPVFADGVLVCSTTGGAFAAVDVVDGTTLWTYDAGPEPAPVKGGFNIQLQLRAMGIQPQDDATDRWAASAATIVRDRVLLTPYASDELHCVELQTGQRVWKSWRRDGLFVGGLSGDTIVVVGRSGLRGIRLADGETAWSKEVAPFPAGTVPVGRGYLSQGRYYVPLTSGEVASFDAETGRLVGRIRPLKPIRLGNLVPTGEMVVSVGLHGTDRFALLSERRAELDAAQVNGAEDSTLARDQARLALATGDVGRAIDLLIEARRSGGQKESDALLLESLVQGLRQAPERFVDRVDFLDDLMRTVPDRTNNWLALAESLAENGRPLLALKIYSGLIEKPKSLDQVQAVSASRTVRLGRRMAIGLEALRAKTDAAGADELGSRIQAMLAGAATIEQLNQYGSQPETAANSLRLAKLGATDERWIEADVLLRKALEHSTSAEGGEAIGQIGALLAAANRPLEAAYWKATNERSVAGDEGAASGQDETVRYESPWANSAIEVSEKAVPTRSSTDSLRTGQRMPVYVDSAEGRRAFELSATYEARSRTLTGLDRWGRNRFQIVLPEAKTKSGVHMNSGYAFIHGVSVGHLLVLYRGDMVATIDCLADEPKLLWSKETGAAISSSSMHMMMIAAARNRMLGGRPNQPGSHSRGIAATSEYVCFQRGRELIAVDPLTAKLLWSRDDLPAGCDLIGDRERIFASPPNDEQASVFRATDGKLLERRPALPKSERLTVLGGSLLRWEADAKPPRCGLFDPWNQQYVWQRELGADTLLAMAGNSAVGIVDPTGTVTLLDVADGTERLSGKVDPLKKLDDVTFLQFDDVVVLATNVPDDDNLGRMIAMRGFGGGKMVNGKLFGLDAASGKLLWSTPIANQQLRVDQPSGVPILIGCNRYQKRVKLKNNSTRSEPPQLLLKCIDCRDGKILHESAAKNSYWANYNFSADPKARKVVVEVADRIVQLQFVAKSE
ncbi:MAG: PQQ-binding-like beta-propeller repeat protein [Planctomycetes bacterium]|nr:PQQ-binding-like beta-propeller repeat protein [Planctomycetota bacterium]MBL7041761.1 PQQ-binding-like beta-propeller repeat protein [Pirellulaceae bacterium]